MLNVILSQVDIIPIIVAAFLQTNPMSINKTLSLNNSRIVSKECQMEVHSHASRCGIL